MSGQKKGIVSNPNLAPYIKESVLAYQEAEMLGRFFTTFCLTQGWMKRISFLPDGIRSFLFRRAFPPLDPQLLRSNALMEISRILANRFGGANLADEIWEWSETGFDKRVAKNLHPKHLFFHGYEHACLASLQQAKKMGIVSFYEQPSQHHAFFTKIVEEQLLKYPNLKNEAIALLNDEKAERRNRRRDEELELADYIICNSSFTQKTLIAASIPPEKLIVIPYGYPTVRSIPNKDPEIFHFIYAGNLSLRKGVHILLQAWRQLPADLPACLTLMGSSQLPENLTAELPENVKWIPNLPYEQAQEKIAQSDVLVLPTLADGFGMVISESMAMGVPVLTTTSSAGPDLIDNYVDGICIAPDDKNALTEALTWCVANREKCKRMGQKAQEKAKVYPWSAYRERLIEEVKARIGNGR